jgi:hypothetical protein
MSTRTCPDWPSLLELAPDLHFKHYTLAEARLPGEVLMTLPMVPLQAVAVCADLEHNVFNPTHTDPQVAAALAESFWYSLDDWVERGGRT